MHKITIFGMLGNDPEMRYLPDGKAVTSFSVASSGDNPNDPKKATWFKCTAWGKIAEACNQYLSKGQQVCIFGQMQSNEFGAPKIWFTNDQQPRANFEVTVQKVQFGRKSSGGVSDNSNDSIYNGGDQPVNKQQTNQQNTVSEDDIPF